MLYEANNVVRRCCDESTSAAEVLHAGCRMLMMSLLIIQVGPPSSQRIDQVGRGLRDEQEKIPCNLARIWKNGLSSASVSTPSSLPIRAAHALESLLSYYLCSLDLTWRNVACIFVFSHFLLL